MDRTVYSIFLIKLWWHLSDTQPCIFGINLRPKGQTIGMGQRLHVSCCN